MLLTMEWFMVLDFQAENPEFLPKAYADKINLEDVASNRCKIKLATALGS